MALPKPVPGLVLRYSYLWHHDYLEGETEGRKDRPCAIVAAIHREENGEVRVLVLPITHSVPDTDTRSVEIPSQIKRHLGMDDARSWIVLTEWNEFTWPGHDLRIMPGCDETSVAYGMLPSRLFAKVRVGVLLVVKSKTVRSVGRN